MEPIQHWNLIIQLAPGSGDPIDCSSKAGRRRGCRCDRHRSIPRDPDWHAAIGARFVGSEIRSSWYSLPVANGEFGLPAIRIRQANSGASVK